MLVLMTFITIMQGHSGLAEENSQHWIISTTKQAISIALNLLSYYNAEWWVIIRLYFSLKSSVASESEEAGCPWHNEENATNVCCAN